MRIFGLFAIIFITEKPILVRKYNKNIGFYCNTQTIHTDFITNTTRNNNREEL